MYSARVRIIYNHVMITQQNRDIPNILQLYLLPVYDDKMAKLLCLFIFTCFCVHNVILFDFKDIARTIHLAPHLRENDLMTKTFKIANNVKITKDNLPEFLTGALNDLREESHSHSRKRRSATPAPSTVGENLVPRSSQVNAFLLTFII